MRLALSLSISLIIYMLFYVMKAFVVDPYAPSFPPINPIAKLGLDYIWLLATVFVWQRLGKTKESLPQS